MSGKSSIHAISIDIYIYMSIIELPDLIPYFFFSLSIYLCFYSTPSNLYRLYICSHSQRNGFGYLFPSRWFSRQFSKRNRVLYYIGQTIQFSYPFAILRMIYLSNLYIYIYWLRISFPLTVVYDHSLLSSSSSLSLNRYL